MPPRPHDASGERNCGGEYEPEQSLAARTRACLRPRRGRRRSGRTGHLARPGCGRAGRRLRGGAARAMAARRRALAGARAAFRRTRRGDPQRGRGDGLRRTRLRAGHARRRGLAAAGCVDRGVRDGDLCRGRIPCPARRRWRGVQCGIARHRMSHSLLCSQRLGNARRRIDPDRFRCAQGCAADRAGRGAVRAGPERIAAARNASGRGDHIRLCHRHHADHRRLQRLGGGW